jgi:hypothetical protein
MMPRAFVPAIGLSQLGSVQSRSKGGPRGSRACCCTGDCGRARAAGERWFRMDKINPTARTALRAASPRSISDADATAHATCRGSRGEGRAAPAGLLNLRHRSSLLSSSTPSSSSLVPPSLPLLPHLSIEEGTILPVPCHEPGTMARDDEHQRVRPLIIRGRFGSERGPPVLGSGSCPGSSTARSVCYSSPPVVPGSLVILFAPAHRQPRIDMDNMGINVVHRNAAGCPFLSVRETGRRRHQRNGRTTYA